MYLQIPELKQGKFVFDKSFSWYALQRALSSCPSLLPTLTKTNRNSFFAMPPKLQSKLAEALLYKTGHYPSSSPPKDKEEDKVAIVAELLNKSPNSISIAIEAGELNPDEVIAAMVPDLI